MITKNNKHIVIRKVTEGDYSDISTYLYHLSELSQKRFGPHGYDLESVQEIHSNSNIIGYLAEYENEIIGYTIIQNGYLQHDADRLNSYGLNLEHQTDTTFAPSVADEWHGLGVGQLLFREIRKEILDSGRSRIILWGGVQASNDGAIQYYERIGFRKLGMFNYHGENYDMIWENRQTTHH